MSDEQAEAEEGISPMPDLLPLDDDDETVSPIYDILDDEPDLVDEPEHPEE